MIASFPTLHLIPQLDNAINWRFMAEVANWTLEQSLRIQSIPAPTFAEQNRARAVADLFQQVGLKQVRLDDYSNVYGLLPASHTDPANPATSALMIAAHTDTIFSADADLTTRREGNLIFGPGLGDNSVGVGALLGLVRALQAANIPLQRDCWFVATSREEGLGDLGGMRAAFERLRGQINLVINLEGLAFGHVYHAGIAVRRLKITTTTPGGHSWLHFGRPSATHALMTLGAHISALSVPASPRTTFNIGSIGGGGAINAIAGQAELWLDLRSEDRGALQGLEGQVRALVGEAAQPELTWSVEVVGDRPAGAIAPQHPLVQAAMAALQQVNVHGVLENGSTDANIPLHFGVPAVTVGITRGGNAHRLDEFIEVTPIADGLRQLTLLTLSQAVHSANKTSS